MLGKGDGLRPLEMGVAGHDGVLVLLRLSAEDRLQLQQLPHDDGDLLPDIHAEVQRHLVVAAAGGVQALARVADPRGEQGLDVHVDVLVVGGEFHLPRFDVCQNDRSRPSWMASLSSLVMMPQSASMAAWAMEPVMSSLYSRWSKVMEALRSFTSASVSF